ncbi:hypothetical protein CSC62_05305 [Pseudoxanthomonas jiangsuensis]|uniref:hypothetical protein n=1 Tax=Pseudoxanthomonas jiangsuensis TaxID=619688 RepID=UPI001391D360|nr:hypothetical protein [Pseudoxanthomonas jiangsuensis]KAF1698327.1 hypothetical protein CSC62_05305 [Pseudoxanthomonas jiangsuensis]
MSTRIESEVDLSAEQIAALYWDMDAEQQASFFAELFRLAGHIPLCMQTAAVVHELVARCDKGDVAGFNGFQTMLAHANDWHESAADIRTWAAKHAITKSVESAKAGLQ